MDERKDLDPNQLTFEAVLAEYKALKDELLQKFRHQLQIYSIIIPAIAIMIGYVLTEKIYDLLLGIPLVTSAFAFRYIWEQSIIVTIADYLRIIEHEIFPEIIGYRSQDIDRSRETSWLGWEHYFVDHFPKPYFYKYTIELLFVGIPIFPALVYSLAAVSQHFTLFSTGVNSSLPVPVHVAVFVVYLLLALYLSWKLWKG